MKEAEKRERHERNVKIRMNGRKTKKNKIRKNLIYKAVVPEHSSLSMGRRGHTGAAAEFEFPLGIFIVVTSDSPHLRNKLAGELPQFLYAAPLYS
jgi:hypothetical protein